MDWIRVEDRLPEPCVQVIVYIPADMMTDFAYLTERGEWQNFYGCDIDPISHWMPLPDEPDIEIN